jgi:hypothetical protein
VTFADDEPSGLASMVGGLIEQNLARDPARRRLLRPSVAQIEASDAEVTITIRTEPGHVAIEDRGSADAHVTITADASRLLALTSAPLRFGLPDALDQRGRAVLGDVLARRIRIRGLLIHPRRVARLASLLSVA